MLQAWVSLGAQAPSPLQVPEPCQVQSLPQLSLSVPQLPQGTERVAPGEHCGDEVQLAGTQPPSATQPSPVPQLTPTQAVAVQVPWSQTLPVPHAVPPQEVG